MRNLVRQLDEIFEVEPNEDVMLEMRLALNAKKQPVNKELYLALQQLYDAVKDIPEVYEYLDGNLIQVKEAIDAYSQEIPF